MNLFIIPGNPQGLFYYQLWKSEILQQNPNFNVCISEYSFELEQVNLGSNFLLDQAQHHAKNLKSFRAHSNEAQIQVIAHSLGGWMAIQMLNSMASEINKLILLQPFLRQPSISGRTLLKAIFELKKFSLLSTVLLKSRKAFDLAFPELKYVTDEELRLCLDLAKHEYSAIVSTRDIPDILKQHSHKITAHYSSKDTWCDQITVKQLTDIVPTKFAPVPHNFIVSQNMRQKMLSQILFELG